MGTPLLLAQRHDADDLLFVGSQDYLQYARSASISKHNDPVVVTRSWRSLPPLERRKHLGFRYFALIHALAGMWPEGRHAVALGGTPDDAELVGLDDRVAIDGQRARVVAVLGQWH